MCVYVCVCVSCYVNDSDFVFVGVVDNGFVLCMPLFQDVGKLVVCDVIRVSVCDSSCVFVRVYVCYCV